MSLYRKYRSQTFSDLVGQDHVVRTLQNGISAGRVAHSYLFTGPRGTGKTSSARLLSKALCCRIGPAPEPDNTCDICTSITEGSCVDVIEKDAASESGVQDIREQIVEAVEYRPMICRYKVFIIDEVHDLSSKAFDALLKTIEEPPPHIIFILATTEYNKVPPTIRSRCQQHEFRRASLQDLIGRLEFVLAAEGMEAESAALVAIARMADGGYRDALTLLEQAILVGDGKVRLQQVYDQLGLVSEDAIDGLFKAIARQDVPKLIDLLEQLHRQGKDSRAILDSMMVRLSDLTRASYNVQDGGFDPGRDASLHETAVDIGQDLILRLRTDVAEAHKLIREISLPRIWLESRLISLAVRRVVELPRSVDTAPEPRPPKAEVVEPPKPIPQEVQLESSGDPLLDEALEAWNKSVIELAAFSVTLGRRLETAKPISRVGSTVVVQLERHNDHEWIVEGKKKPAVTILEVFRKHFASDAEIEYVVRKKGGISMEGNAAVELPLEGKLLEDAVKQLFG